MMRRGLWIFISLVIIFSGAELSAANSYITVPPDTSHHEDSFHRVMMKKEAEQLSGDEIRGNQLLISSFRGFELPPPRVLNIIAVGDVMPGTNFPSEDYLPADCRVLFDPVRSLISSADLSIANLEGVFSSEGGTAKNCNDPKSCYVFRMPDEYASCIREAGFDLLGMANNHINDFGYTGRMNTVKVLEKEGFGFAGFPEYPYTIYQSNGVKVGFCAFAPHTGTLSLKDYDGAAELVSRLDTLCDIVIVAFHGGAEGRKHQHVTREDEMFYGYNRGNVHHFSHKVIDAGADLVIGHGPHVVRAVEFYKGKLIAYSLGNFCTYRRFNLSGPNANAPLLQVWIDEFGDLVNARVHSFYQPGEGGPVPDPRGEAARRILELSKIDFPGQNMLIDQEGWIIKNPVNDEIRSELSVH